MTDAQIRTMLLDVICDVDFDLYQSFQPENSDNPEESEATMLRLIEVVRKHLPKQAEATPTTGKRLYVGNLTYDATEDDLRDWFEGFGTVQSAWVVSDRETGRSKGFGFVEMASDAEAAAAVSALNGKKKDGRILTVNIARPKTDTPSNDKFKRKQRDY